MRLKKLRKTTKVKINNEGEYLLLMELAEKTGCYIWAGTLNEPTYFNDMEEYRCQSKTIILSSMPPMMTTAIGTITRSMTQASQKDAIPLRKVIKFEVGDKVRVRKEMIRKIKEEKSLLTKIAIPELKKYVNKENIIEDSFSFDSKRYYYLKGCKDIFYPKKWLDPILPSVPKEETVAGKEE